VNTVLRGNITVGSQIESTRSVKQQEAPKHPVRKKCLVAASGPLKQLRITMIEEATEARIAEISLACSLPLGWKIEQGKPLSPWASISKETWPANKNLSADHSCRVTQRPALLAGSALEFRVKSVPPKKEIKWTNPDGDGEYKITVTNTTDKPLPVPALLSRNKKVLWEESLVILCQGKTYTCPGCKSDWQSVTPTELAPKESLSTVVQVLRL
jgi:hypothetical protein